MSQDPELFPHSSYFEARAIEERRMAMAAKDPHVRAIHLEMAERYAEAAKANEDKPVKLTEDPRRAG
jgi:hypothetical protein